MSGSAPGGDRGVVGTVGGRATFAGLVDRARRGDGEAARRIVEEYGGAIRREVRFSILDGRLRRVLDESDIFPTEMARFLVELWAGRFDPGGPGPLVASLRDRILGRVADRAGGRVDDRRHGPPADPAAAVAGWLEGLERRLSPAERAIVGLRREGASWEEVAARLDGDGSAEASRDRLGRAIDRVGRELGVGD